jgi:DNA-directed RNA polymerase specialized sigma24 family protein
VPRTPSTRRGDGRAAAAAAASSRADAIAAIYPDTHSELRGYVTAATRTDALTIDDACSHAWAQLLSHPDVDVATDRCSIVRWLKTTAIREAWRLHEQRRLPGRAEIDGYTQNVTPSAEDVAAMRARIDLVREIPERPRRFLLRLMLGYSYDEIASHEGVSATTTNKQIARAKRLLRELEQRDRA